LVGTKLTIGDKSMDISSEDLADHKSGSLDVLIISVSEGVHVVTLSQSEKILFKTTLILNTGQTRKLRVRQ
jgi:hypothetical protein